MCACVCGCPGEFPRASQMYEIQPNCMLPHGCKLHALGRMWKTESNAHAQQTTEFSLGTFDGGGCG